MDGHGVQVGGVIVDSGNFDWDAHSDKYPGLTAPDASYHGLTFTKSFGKLAYITKATTTLMRDMGAIQSPQNAFYLGLGLQTLHVRMPRHCSSALKVARYLEASDDVSWVNFPDLESSADHALQQKYMSEGSCGVMCFGLKAPEGVPVRDFTSRFMDNLSLITIETHVADCYTCVLHPASHTHRQLSDEQLKEAGVSPDLIRLSIGLEDPEDIIDDIRQAIKASR